ncbi:hypothetical protein ElyMa_001453600 [Elysia marginata]|uniref:Uncharacterized protein n=1 Tax=Elysia marginata TaxID=1093978 RepID=A0AAV4J021_9GAST|nr:hypothetical protein ElyMa_001453600 [Elysia marginata]
MVETAAPWDGASSCKKRTPFRSFCSHLAPGYNRAAILIGTPLQRLTVRHTISIDCKGLKTIENRQIPGKCQVQQRFFIQRDRGQDRQSKPVTGPTPQQSSQSK